MPHDPGKGPPPKMVAVYGDHGYGWKLKEIVGALIVNIPLSVPIANAERMFVTFMGTLTGVFVAVFILLNIMLTALITKRLSAMAQNADEISKGNFDMGEFDEKGSAFNRMRRSLVKAMEFFNKAD